MKTTKAKKLSRRLMTITDFSSVRNVSYAARPTEDTSDTTATMTIIITTISTHRGLRN
ncbi:hypothetical protein [Mucilaginibacter limnophilus]|uniref:hypothetical protein n=1 Tax=Mucilaginibacter limnophilus TaxID=1932778 RepID=UPI0013E3278E|nr:hypothetical protein [Mucilaginibacter limnophilus]